MYFVNQEPRISYLFKIFYREKEIQTCQNGISYSTTVCQAGWHSDQTLVRLFIHVLHAETCEYFN